VNSSPSSAQLSAQALVLGVVLSIVLGGANAYLGLFAGLTVSASIPAAVVSMGILRALRRGTILENNIVQTAASAGESLAAGAIFTFPALILVGYWQTFDYGWVTWIAGLGGLLGVLFTVPLRRALVVEQGLAFPEGTATAAVLRAGHGEEQGIRFLFGGALAGAAVKLSETGLRLWTGTAETAAYLGKGLLYFGANLSPALLSVGYIVGLNIAVLVFAGGAFAWLIAIPLYLATHASADPGLAAMLARDAPAADTAGFIWSTRIRYLGVGAMLVGGVWALINIGPSLAGAVRKRPGTAVAATGHNDIPMPWILTGVVCAALPVAWIYRQVTGSYGVAIPLTVLMLVAGFLFSAVAGYMAGIVGSSNNPISGVTIATLLVAALLLFAMLGADSDRGPAAAVMVAAVVCCAAAIGGDNLQDLKAGHLLGATPWKQQVVQMIGTVSAALVMAPILNLLLQAYGIGAPTETHPSPLAAPQAMLMASVARGVFGGALPWDMIGMGAVLAVAVIVLDVRLQRRGSPWRAPVLAIAVGVYLPLELSVPILAGGVIAWLINRRSPAVSPQVAIGPGQGRTALLLAAGLITGEALLGIGIAIPIVFSGNREVLAIAEPVWGGAPGAVAVSLIALWLLRVGLRNP